MICIRCKQKKDILDFHIGKSVCKLCRKPESINYKIKYPQKHAKRLEYKRNISHKNYAKIYENRLCKQCKKNKTGKHKTLCTICKKENKNRVSKEWRINNKKRVLELKRRWNNDNPLKVKEMKARNYQKHKDNYRKLTKRWKEKNPERRIILDKKHSAKVVAEMPDSYIIRCIIKGTTLTTSDITKEIIELSRLNLTLKRLGKEKLKC